MIDLNSHPSSKPVVNEDGVLPLINIVFLLLIFFMLAGQMLSPSALQVDPVKTIRPSSDQRPELTVSMDQQGALALNGEAISLAKLLIYCQQTQPLKVYIKADQASLANEVLHLARQLQANQAHQVLLLTESLPQ